MHFRKFILLFCLLFPVVTFADPASQELVQLLSSLQTLQAQFTQTVMDGRGKAIQKTSGQMSMQRPGKFRWQTFSPSRQLLIADGNKIWFYDEGLEQVTVQKQQAVSHNSPAMLLSGSPEQLSQQFIISKQGSTFNLVPKNKEGLFRSVQLTFSNQELANMKLIDNLGQITVVQFSQVKNNPALNASLFTFKVPQGVDVVQQ